MLNATSIQVRLEDVTTERKGKTVAEKTQDITTSQFINSLSELSKAMVDTANATTEYNITFIQNVLENSTEVLKSFVRSACRLMQEQLEQVRKQYSGSQGSELVDKMIEVQQRNLAFVQSTLENEIEMLKSQVGLIRAFTRQWLTAGA